MCGQTLLFIVIANGAIYNDAKRLNKYTTKTRLNEYERPSDLFFLSLSDQHDNTTLSPAAGAAHSLHQSYRTLVSVKADDQVHDANVQTFLADTRRH